MGDIGSQAQNAEELPGVEDEAWLRVIEVGSLCCLPMALKACLHLNVMDILAQHHPHPLSSSQIVSHLPSVSNPTASLSLDRILRLLASHGILTSSLLLSPHDHLYVRTYALNHVSNYLVKNEHSASLAPMVLLNQDKVIMDIWHYLHEAILTGNEPFTNAHGIDAFSYGQHDLRFDKLFNSAMANHTKLLINSLLATYSGFDNVATLVDVGGGFASCLSMIISKHPHIKGINFDQPHVVVAAPKYPGVENVGGDMFLSIPKADAIFMKWILHDWSDEDCVKILENCYKALPNDGGKVIVLDALLPNAVEKGLRARVGYHLDILMLAYNQGGRERTHEELLTICKLAGFSRLQVVSKLNECTLVEIYKS